MIIVSNNSWNYFFFTIHSSNSTRTAPLGHSHKCAELVSLSSKHIWYSIGFLCLQQHFTQRLQHFQFHATMFLLMAYTRHLTLLIWTLHLYFYLHPKLNLIKLILISICRTYNVHQLWLISHILWNWLEELIKMGELCCSSFVVFSHIIILWFL